MLKKNLLILLWGTALFGFGCTAPVLRQDIPVSTNPMGAKIYADGKPAGQTPTTVSLERTRNHILTLVKENYHQQDVVITRQYQSNKVMMNAVMSGVNSGLFFKNTQMGLSSGMSAISSQEQTGEAYLLAPATVSVNLVPLSGASTQSPDAGGYQQPPVTGTDSQPAPTDQDISATDLLKTGIAAGAAVGAAQAKPIEKNWETSSSTKSYVRPDGTQVTKKSSTSVGVGVNPAGLVNTLEKLFN